MKSFIVVGENIHCTRIYKVGGSFVKEIPGQCFAIVYGEKGAAKHLPVPQAFLESADWAAGKVKHCAVAAWHGLYGDGAGKAAAADYLQTLARKQQAADASYLDVNVDEFSTDLEERLRVMQWMAGVVQQAATLPLSIDSSNPAILRAGLKACDAARGRPMVNSVSLERAQSIPVAAEFKAVVIASAAGEKDLPCTTEGRLENIAALMKKLDAAGIRKGDIFIDPLVFPVATDSNNGRHFLEAVAALRAAYGATIHISGGLSNVSFGMPNRRLINQVFACLAVDAGADGGIVDPLQINGKIIAGLDRNAESFKLAQALLTGEDLFGAEFIAAHREGRLGKE
jgi:5-methyltetrahydrofolate--homocysteine methyltransferase